MAAERSAIRGIILAGGYRWENSVFDRLLPRPLVPVAHKPLISYALSWLSNAGVSNVTVCGNRDTQALKAQLGRHVPVEMSYTYWEDQVPRGAAGCLRDAASGVRSAATERPCDCYIVTEATALPSSVNLPDLLDRHWASGAEVTVVVHSDPARRGTPGATIPAGIYVVNHSALDSIPAHGFVDIKEHFIPRIHRAGTRVYAYATTSVVPRVMNAQTYLAVNAMVTEALVADDAVPPGYVRSGEALIHAEATLAGDVVLAGPVLIGEGADIQSGAVVIGPTSIGCDVTVQPGALVSRSAVWRRSIVEAGASIDLCILGDDAVIQAGGPGSTGDTAWTTGAELVD